MFIIPNVRRTGPGARRTGSQGVVVSGGSRTWNPRECRAPVTREGVQKSSSESKSNRLEGEPVYFTAVWCGLCEAGLCITHHGFEFSTDMHDRPGIQRLGHCLFARGGGLIAHTWGQLIYILGDLKRGGGGGVKQGKMGAMVVVVGEAWE